MMKQRQRSHRQDTPQRITKAVTHIRLIEVNPGKLAALNALAPVYLALCLQYVTLFCTDRKAVKVLLLRRHEEWKQENGWP